MVQIDSINFTDAYTGPLGTGGDTTGVPFLMGEVGDLILATIGFTVIWQTVDHSIVFTSNTMTRSDTGGSFITDGFKNGDTAVVSGTTSNDGSYTVQNVTDTVLTVTISTMTPETDASTTISGQTPVKGLDVYQNCVPNTSGVNFTSLSDLAIQKYSLNWSTSPSATIIPPVGNSLAWWSGKSAKLTYNGISGGGQSFTLKIPFIIGPTWLAGQMNNYVNKVSPSYFYNTCLKYIYQIDARFSNNPNVDHTSGAQIRTLGNTGWFNEFLNGGQPNYTFTSISYKKSGTTQVLNSIDFNGSTDVTIELASNALFASGAPINVQFSWLPLSPSAYQNKSTSYPQCLLQDNVIQTIGSSAANGVNYGTGYQALIDVVCTLNSSSKVTVTFTVILGSTSKAVFSGNYGKTSDLWYSLSCSPQGDSVTSLATTDRTTVLCDVNQVFTDLDDSSLMNIITDGTTDVHFYSYGNLTKANTNVADFIGSYQYAKMQFNILNNCILKSVNVSIVAYNNSSGGDFSGDYSDDFNVSTANNYDYEFPLETWYKNINNSTSCVPGNVAINETRGYPVKGVFNVRALNYTPSLNTPNYYAYQLDYGFQLDYKYWLSLQNYGCTFEEIAVRYWPIYSNQPNWSLKFKIVTTVTGLTGIDTVFVRYCDIQAADVSNASTTFSLQTTDNTGNYDFNHQIASDVQTLVTFTFNGDFSSFPSGYSDFTGQLWFWYDDGTQVMDLDSTEDDVLPTSYWVGQPIVTKLDDSTVTITGLLDITKAPQIKNYRIYARLGYK